MRVALAVAVAILVGIAAAMLSGCTVRRPGPFVCLGCTLNAGGCAKQAPQPPARFSDE